MVLRYKKETANTVSFLFFESIIYTHFFFFCGYKLGHIFSLKTLSFHYLCLLLKIT